MLHYETRIMKQCVVHKMTLTCHSRSSTM